jgi:hypothetical protein
MLDMQIITLQIKSAKTRIEKLEGRDHLVVPVIPVVEGVLNGAFVSANEFNKYPMAWAGRPITVNHPQKNGQHVSANQTDILEANTIGKLMNPKPLGKKLKAEMWIDIEKCTALGGEALQTLEKLQKGEPLEVSTAYFPDAVKESGVFNGKKFTEKHINLRPDHLAALPNGIGACSWADGAGAPRVASQQEEKYIEILSVNMESDEIDELEVNFNPYHDERGRFATGDKSTSFNLPKDPKMREKLIEKERQRTEKQFGKDEAQTKKEYESKLIKAGGKEWQKGDKHRIYFNTRETSEAIGLKVDFYKTGNVSSATINGDHISNSRARGILFDLQNGGFHYDFLDSKFHWRSEMNNNLASQLVDHYRSL